MKRRETTMEIKFIKIYLSGAKRINELFEEKERKEAEIRTLEKAIRFKQLQHKGYAKELETQLRQIEDLKSKYKVLCEERDEWIHKYRASEEARKSLGEKLEKAMGAIELLRGSNPSAAQASAPHTAGETKAEGGARA